MNRYSLATLTPALSLRSVPTAVRADTLAWADPIGSVCSVFTNWNNLSGTASGLPGAGETAAFREAGPYVVWLRAAASRDERDTEAGDVTFPSAAGPFAYDIATGSAPSADFNLDGRVIAFAAASLPLSCLGQPGSIPAAAGDAHRDLLTGPCFFRHRVRWPAASLSRMRRSSG